MDGCPERIANHDYFARYNAEKQALNRGFSIRSGYDENRARTHGKESQCIACRQCERSCPQHLPIVDYLRQVAATFEKES